MLVKIPGYEDYGISENGLVYSYKSNKYLTTHKNNKGYNYVTFCISGKNKNLLVSRLLMFMFGNLPSLDSNLEVDHIDMNKDNNHLSNLQVLSKESHEDKTHRERGNTIGVSLCECGNKKLHNSKVCKVCSENNLIRPEITKEIIEAEVFALGWVGAGRVLGLSDNGLRKRYKRLNGNPKELGKNKCEIE